MSESLVYTMKNGGGKVYEWIRSVKEIQEGWEGPGQGNYEARLGKNNCVVVDCNMSEAILLTQIFLHYFAIPTCCHYDGDKLSMFCGHAGSSGGKRMISKLTAIAQIITER